MNNELNQAVTLIKAGNKTEGAIILAEVLKQDPKNERAWLWMSNAVTEVEQRCHCLKQALKINPANKIAQEALDSLEPKSNTQAKANDSVFSPPASIPPAKSQIEAVSNSSETSSVEEEAFTPLKNGGLELPPLESEPPPKDSNQRAIKDEGQLVDPNQIYYKHSGAIGCAGLIYMTIFGTLATLILGIVYGYAIYYIPFIYLNFFITLFYGGIVGLSVGIAGKLGKVRNTGVLMLFGFIFGLLAEYAGWVGWTSAIIEEVSFLPLFFSPLGISALISLAAAKGVWSIFGLTPTGLALYLIWGLEAFLVIGTSTLVAVASLMSTPFCEQCKRWVDESESISLLSAIPNPDELKAQLEQGNYSALNGLKMLEQKNENYSELELMQCSKCQQFHLMTLKSVTIKLKANGKEDEKKEDIVENLLLSSTVYEAIKNYER